jgi:O-methyltransferase
MEHNESPDIIAYFEAQRRHQPRYLGQLTESFQARLAAYHDSLTPDDCDFYHSIALGGGDVLYQGEWDLRGHEPTYLGNYDFRGKRILEAGPATGWLSAYMAGQGAELVVLDLPLGECPELVPHPEVDMDSARASGAISASRLRNSWWFSKALLGYQARAVYADIYAPPPDLGRFDAAVLGSILLHLSSPFRALQSIASLVDDTIIVTDVFSAPQFPAIENLKQNIPSLVLFNATRPPIGLVHWWSLGPDVIVHMLELLGFSDIAVETHAPISMKSKPRLFTVVGRRHKRPRKKELANRWDEADVSRAFLSLSDEEEEACKSLPIPPPAARFLVAGTDNADVFLDLGRRGFAAIKGSVEGAGQKLSQFRRVLDFGCGVGRVLRWWRSYPTVEVHGTDFQKSSVEWCQKNLSFGRFQTNTLQGPLDYPDSHFDLIYCLSVFTHLPEHMQLSWFRELVRILRPQGMIYFTTHGSHYKHLLTSAQRQAFEQDILIETGGEQPGTNHCAIFHPSGYVTKHFIDAHGLALVEFLPCGAAGNPLQDSYLVRKNA